LIIIQTAEELVFANAFVLTENFPTLLAVNHLKVINIPFFSVLKKLDYSNKNTHWRLCCNIIVCSVSTGLVHVRDGYIRAFHSAGVLRARQTERHVFVFGWKLA
jgi:hypothetical protein